MHQKRASYDGDKNIRFSYQFLYTSHTRPGQVQMPGNLGGIWLGDQGPPPPLQVLGEDPYDGAGRRVLRRILLQVERHESGGTSVTYHLQCGDGYSGPLLGIPDVGRAEGDYRNNSSDNKSAQPKRQTIRACNDGRQWTEEGIKVQKAIFYADDRMVASTNTVWTQTAFGTLTGLFDWVGLKTNVLKTVGMVCHPYQAVGVRVYEAYTSKMTGAGRSNKEIKRERVSCSECGKYLEKNSLAFHYQTQNVVAKGVPGQEGRGYGGGNEPRTYRMAFLTKSGPRH